MIAASLVVGCYVNESRVSKLRPTARPSNGRCPAEALDSSLAVRRLLGQFGVVCRSKKERFAGSDSLNCGVRCPLLLKWDGPSTYSFSFSPHSPSPRPTHPTTPQKRSLYASLVSIFDKSKTRRSLNTTATPHFVLWFCSAARSPIDL